MDSEIVDFKNLPFSQPSPPLLPLHKVRRPKTRTRPYDKQSISHIGSPRRGPQDLSKANEDKIYRAILDRA